MKNIEFQSEPTIFTTGAFLKPMKVTDGEGKEIWVWFVSEFVDDGFKDGQIYNPKESSNSLKTLTEESENN